MWISRETYDELREEAIMAQTEARVLSGQVQSLETSIGWMRLRLTQVEQERARLILNYTGVQIATPRLEASNAPTPVSPNEALSAQGLFNDLGDDLAQKMGISWSPDGSVSYRKIEPAVGEM